MKVLLVRREAMTFNHAQRKVYITLAIKNRNDDFELKELRHHDEVSFVENFISFILVGVIFISDF